MTVDFTNVILYLAIAVAVIAIIPFWVFAIRTFFYKNNKKNDEPCIHTVEDCENCMYAMNCTKRKKGLVEQTINKEGRV